LKVSGSALLKAPRRRVWDALNDPAVLVRTIPGCQRLEAIGDDAYRMTLTAGVASIKGVYQGEVRLSDQQPLDTFVLKAAGSGTPGTVSADVVVRLEETGDDTTTVTYDADATVGGMIGGVGQRMLSGVAKKTAGEFFSAVDDLLTGRTETAADRVQAASPESAGAAGVFEAPGAAATLSTAGSAGDFVSGALVGAAAALLGALVGGWLAGRRRNG
jgi:carbon monoxide dehydrogenase subunit G